MGSSISKLKQKAAVHPRYPIPVLAFLKNELQLGEKYIVAELGTQTGTLSELLHNHVRLVCAVSEQQETLNYLEQHIGASKHFLTVGGSPLATSLESDTIDCVVINQRFENWEATSLCKECERILRLNSFTVLIFQKIAPAPQSFTEAYLHFFKNFSTTQQEEYDISIPTEKINTFYIDGHHEKIYANQLRLNLEQLQQYYQLSAGAYNTEHPDFEKANKALRILFHQYAQNGIVVLDYQIHLFFGLFNKNIPAISLQKSVFFHILRPFAFLFYVLVKANIYFWKGLYSLRRKAFGKKE